MLEALLLVVMAGSTTPDFEARCCLTEWFDYITETDEDRIRKRFALYEDLGVDMLRLTIYAGHGWCSEAYLNALRDAPFRLKIILDNMPQEPEFHTTDEHGRTAASGLNYWHPELRIRADEMTQVIFERLKASGLEDRVDFVIPAMGMAGEPLYPHPWTTGFDDPSFWCYGEHAQADFRESMKAKYDTIEDADAAWGSDFADWDAVHVLPPGTLPGTYWEDVLVWYRDTKRDYVEWNITNTQRYTDKTVLLYVPGVHFSEDDWQEAIDTGRGNVWITIMTDHEFLVDQAAKHGCWVQYTGLGPDGDADRVAAYIQEKGYDKVGVWGENPGVPQAVTDPVALARMVVDLGLHGLDLTFSSFLFEDDGITPNHLWPAMGEGFQLIRDEAP